jgi:regulation of enolase protein 1 (concanavalin A-like superfamily)
MEFYTANLIPSNANPGPSDTGKFKLRAVPPTDIWRKPPNLDNFTAPIIYNALPISTFKSARVTAKGPWKTLYDQGGLFLVLPPKKGGFQKRWFKSGIEFYQGKPMMSVVAADEWADWSLLPLSKEDEAKGSMTVAFEREEEDGSRVCNSPDV